VINLEDLNRLPQVAFVETLGAIFEHSPWVAERAAPLRPFASRLHLLDAMRNLVRAATLEEQLSLIRAHPQLGARARSFARLTAESAREQRGAGLDACSDEEFAVLQWQNGRYVEKFAFPFILAVRGHDPQSIIGIMERRLTHDVVRERSTALTEIGLIAGYRLADTVATAAGVEITAMLERLLPWREEHLLREWILAVGLQVHAGGCDGLLTPWGTDAATASRPKLGIHFDMHARALCCDGKLALLMGIAVAQQLREKGIRPPFDLLVMAHPTEAVTSNLSSFLYRAEEVLDVPALDHAACALEEFLLQTQGNVPLAMMTHD
jgi:OHCU decarboxylase